MSRLKNLTGNRYERLVVLRRAENHGSDAAWLCRCDCGTEKVVRGRSLVRGRTTSCGCRRDEISRERMLGTTPKIKRHGKAGTPIYAIWQAMKQRCVNPNSKSWPNYGGRGIDVCARWLESFDAFYEDMGDPPSGLTLDRIDNNSGYRPDNCRWATRSEQQFNRRNGRMYRLEPGTT